ncbi:adenosine deaminase [Aureobasidium pullulans]|uniref:Adenine deaminase n=1 Tax=Aureobasidium pullulans TaxID=5580 RepID=A0A4S9RMU4_AURPU|nr:adenosine deaminase [Aureobasidium pullulans]THY97874.1 adenosine deaminase [Aureobasidium pullulans]THZ21441.1 adenosine deaminase [Aureobasidium pullulans]
MCKGQIHDLLIALPKCEHHIHIEGALTPRLLFKFAARNTVDLASADDEVYTSEEQLQARYGSFASLAEFIRYFTFGSSVLLTAEDFKELAYDYFTKAHEQSVKHAEVFFDPQAHTSRGIAYEIVIQGLSRAKQQAEHEFGMSIEYIPCILRHHGLDSATRMFQEVKDAGHFADGVVAGLGMAGDELVHPPEYFESIYDDARTAGVRCTAHVGQAGPAEFVSSALENLRAKRVDHGWISKTDNQLMQRLAETNTLVTLCPISNFTLGFVGSIAEVPIREFLDRGVRFSINSDDPAYFGNYIQENYCAVQDAFDLTESDWRTIALNAVEGSWCSVKRKKVLEDQVTTAITRWKATQAA